MTWLRRSSGSCWPSTVAFSQVELVTFCVMGNHFHLLVRLDNEERNPLEDASDKVFLDHLELIYSDDTVQKIGWQLESLPEWRNGQGGR